MNVGVILVQYFIGRYSRYRTISNDITRYSRYQTVFLKLQEIITAQEAIISKTKSSAYAELVVFCRAVPCVPPIRLIHTFFTAGASPRPTRLRQMDLALPAGEGLFLPLRYPLEKAFFFIFAQSEFFAQTLYKYFDLC